MPADLPSLIVAAESATADDEPRLLREVADALLDEDLISSDAWHAIWDALNAFTLNEDLRPCLLGAALLLKPATHRCGFEEAGMPDVDQSVEAWCWPYEIYWEPDWREGCQGYRDHPNGSRSAAATPALAVLGSILRALQAAAGATEAGR